MTTSELNLEPETPDQRRARHKDNYPHYHDINGHKLNLSVVRDATDPIDSESGLHIATDAPAWSYPIGHTQYQPHPDSIAAHTTTAAPAAETD